MVDPSTKEVVETFTKCGNCYRSVVYKAQEGLFGPELYHDNKTHMFLTGSSRCHEYGEQKMVCKNKSTMLVRKTGSIMLS